MIVHVLLSHVLVEHTVELAADVVRMVFNVDILATQDQPWLGVAT